MNKLNPMFRSNNQQQKIYKPNKILRNTQVERTTRSDKKTDIKVPLSLNLRQELHYQARKARMYPTDYASKLVMVGLKNYTDFPAEFYEPKEKTVHVKLTQYYADKLFGLKISLDSPSLKQTTHRILVFMLKRGGSHGI